MKHILFAFALLASSLTAALVYPTESAEALGSYSCPLGQLQGVSGRGQDIRYCYTNPCPDGQQVGNASSYGNNTDPSKCYEPNGTSPSTGNTRWKEKGDAKLPAGKNQKMRFEKGDNMKCPPGSYRGGLVGGQDENMCYTCTDKDCQDTGQKVVPQNYAACLKSDTACIDKQRKDQADYIKSIKDSAPGGYTLPTSNTNVTGSTEANTFCDYYKKLKQIDAYDTNYTYRACVIGYEVGFGKGSICTREYLFGHKASHRPTSTKNAARFKQYVATLQPAEAELLVADSIKACLDGWTQYSVDYWMCDGNTGCQQGLRVDKSRVINPGARPNKRTFIDENGNQVETYTAAATSQNCGSVKTAFFTCNFGSGVQNSSLWQMLEMILNIMIGLVGISAVGGLVYAAIRYSSAGDNASQVEQAKTIIKNVIIGVVLFLATWAILQYMIPGGIF